MSPQIKYAYKTHNTWVYRRTYPKALQETLGTALKQSLKTSDATQAKARVAELNQTFTTIIKEAQAHALATPHTATSIAAQGPRLAVGRPRYQRARLVGERLVAELAQAYLAEVSQRLRPGSFRCHVSFYSLKALSDIYEYSSTLEASVFVDLLEYLLVKFVLRTREKGGKNV